MYISGSIVLIVVGAVLRYAVADSIEKVDLALVGLIPMAGGAIGLGLSLRQQLLWRDRVAGGRDRMIIHEHHSEVG